LQRFDLWGVAMVKPVVTRDAFRGLFALFAARAHHDAKGEAEDQLLRLFKSTEDIPEHMLTLWSARTESLSSEAIGNTVSPVAHEIVDGSAHYDHASDFLRRLLRDLDRDVH
jgi:hypothetical protein